MDDASAPTTRFVAWLSGITAVGLALRVLVFLTEHRGMPTGFNDGPYYSGQAIDLARGVLFRDPTTGRPGAEHGPLTAVLLAPFSGNQSLDDQRVGSILIGTVTIVVLGLVGRRIGGPLVGLVGAGIAALYANLWVNDGLVMSEGPGALLVSLWLLTGLRWHDRPGWQRAVVWGLVGGLGALARSELLLLVVLSVVLVVRSRPPERWKPAAAVAGTALAVLAPWVVWNNVRFERSVVLTTNDGTTLRGANCDDTYTGSAIGSWSIECLVLDGGDAVRLESSIRSATWRDEGIDYARAHVGRTPVVVAARAARLLDVYGLDHMVDEDVRDDRPRWASWLGIVSWWALAPLAALGIWRARGPARLLLLSPAVVVLATGLLFYGGHRIRSPFEPAVAVAAALAMTRRVPRP